MEGQSNIIITSDEIKSTKAFQSLSLIQQKINMNRNSRIAIQNGVNVALNRGLDLWKEQTNGSYFHVSVVTEIYNTKKS